MDILELEKQIFELDLDNKLYLANSLFKNIEESAEEDFDDEWIALAEERLKEIEEGKVELIDENEMLKYIEEF
jgi:hypothetical protein